MDLIGLDLQIQHPAALIQVGQFKGELHFLDKKQQAKPELIGIKCCNCSYEYSLLWALSEARSFSTWLDELWSQPDNPVWRGKLNWAHTCRWVGGSSALSWAAVLPNWIVIVASRKRTEGIWARIRVIRENYKSLIMGAINVISYGRLVSLKC